MNTEVEDLWPFVRELDLGVEHQRVLSVTGVLRRAGMVRWHIPREHLARLAEHGRDIHMAWQDVGRGDVPDYWSALPLITGYVTGFQKFCADFQYKAVAIEMNVDHPAGYRGRLDTCGLLQGKRPVVIDFKKGTPTKGTPYQYQLAAYAEAVRFAKLFGPALPERWCVYVAGDGTYKIRKYENPMDFAHFTALLTTARLREAAGLVDERDEREFDNLLRYSHQMTGEIQEPRL